MKRVIATLGASAGVALACATTPPTDPPRATAPEFGSFGIDLSARDPSVDPGDDFYRYANGAWLDSYQLADDETRYGPMVELSYRTERQVREILEGLLRDDPPPGSIERKVADYYASYMDVEALNEKGIDPLRPQLEEIAAIEDRGSLVDALGRAVADGTQAPLAAVVSIDRKDPDRHLLTFFPSGLGLPDRSFYLEEPFAELRAAYREHIAQMLTFAGRSEARAAAEADAILALETQIAQHHWPRTELRDRDRTYNPYTLEELAAAFPDYPWRRHVEASDLDPEEIDRVNLVAPSATPGLVDRVQQTPLDTWKAYLTYHLVTNHASLLGDAIDDANFAFHGRVLQGQPKQRDRWKRGVGLVAGSSGGFGDAVGRMYVERHFPPRAKRMMTELVENLRAALRERVETLEWMGPETRREALAKLATFRPKIGYPSQWKDFSGVTIVPGDLMANYRAVDRFWYEDMTARLGEPTDREEWGMTPQTVNAYYNPTFNEIVFPAAILQAPFFDPNADPAVNYGAIGAVIGHEMGHGFDDQGSKSDAAGIERNWWTDRDRANFEARAGRLVAQYDAYEPIEGHRVSGELTLGENIGDLGGLSMAHRAYRISLDGEEPAVLEGFSGDQRFFLSWAQVWRAKYRDALLIRLLKSDNHSPPRYRVNGVVPHMDAWYRAFAVEPDDALYLRPELRVQIW